MPTFERSHTISLFRNPDTGKGGSLPYSPPTAQKTISGSGFGVAPTIAIAEYFMSYDVGTQLAKGNWDTALYGATSAGSYPKVYTLGSTRGFGSRDTDGTNALTGFVKQSAPYTDYMCMWQMGVPDGKYFSGATEGRTLPPASNLKMGWVSDDGLDDSALADLVSLSRTSTNNYAMVGNQSLVSLSNNATFDWDTPNAYFAYHKAGALPFVNNGTAISTVMNSAGVYTTTQSNTPLFRKLAKVIITVLSDTDYSVTVAGQVATINSGAGATLTSIVNALITEVNSKGTAWVASMLDTNSDGIAEGLSLTATTGTDPSVSVGANMVITTLRPQFDRISTHWQGNNNQVGCLHVFPYFMQQVGANCGSCIVLNNGTTLNPSAMAIPYDSWSDTEIKFTATAAQASGRTHWIRLFDGLPVQTGAL